MTDTMDPTDRERQLASFVNTLVTTTNAVLGALFGVNSIAFHMSAIDLEGPDGGTGVMAGNHAATENPEIVNASLSRGVEYLQDIIDAKDVTVQ